MTLNEKALEAATRERHAQNHTHEFSDAAAQAIITAYFDSLAEQGISLVDVREDDRLSEWLLRTVGSASSIRSAQRVVERMVADVLAGRLVTVAEVVEWLRDPTNEL